MVENWCDDERDTHSVFLGKWKTDATNGDANANDYTCIELDMSSSEGRSRRFKQQQLDRKCFDFRVNPRDMMFDETRHFELNYQGRYERYEHDKVENIDGIVKEKQVCDVPQETNASLLDVVKFAYS